MSSFSSITNFLKGIAELAWPGRCDLCDAQIAPESEFRSLCSHCLPALEADQEETCPRCAARVGPYVDTSKGCPSCKNSAFGFRGAVRLGPYETPWRDAVLKIKKLGHETLAEELGTVLARRFQARGETADFVIPVPLHWRKQWERGYNQAESLALGMAKSLQLPSASRLVRTKNTIQQRDVSAAERRTNVAGIFRVKKPEQLRNLRIVLVDDVMTTGATVDSAARTLLQAGAAQVWVAVVAHD